MNLINIFNIVIVALMLVPSIISAVKAKKFKSHCNNRAMKIVEWVGRILCIVLMVYPLGKKEYGFPAAENFIIYVFGNIILIAVYLLVWVSYFKKENKAKAVILTAVPVMVFILCGLTLDYWLLIFAAVLFGIGHIYVTLADSVNKHKELKAEKKAEKEKELATEQSAEAETVEEKTE